MSETIQYLFTVKYKKKADANRWVTVAETEKLPEAIELFRYYVENKLPAKIETLCLDQKDNCL